MPKKKAEIETVNPEHEKLIEVLKFTPRTYKISMWGYGGEKVMGRVDREVWDYCMEHQVDLSDVAWDSDAAEEMGLDADRLPFPPGSWYECDSMAHVNGVSKDAGTLQIEDENGNVVYERRLEELDDEDDSPEIECFDESYIDHSAAGTVYFVGSSNEKGTFFEGEIALTAPFDISKLKLIYEEVAGDPIINTVFYDEQDIDNYGGSTDGKSSDMDMYLVHEDGEIERYAPEEKDWGHPACGVSPSSWESSVKFDFKKHKPVHSGYYSVNWAGGSTYGSLYWDGKEFGDWEYGKFNPVNQSGVKNWSGYNWDTTDWSNQPPEPPDVQCNNKKCGWVGRSEERIEDSDYNDHCPNCNGTDFDWIDYDPNTAKGRKNREQHCIPAFPNVDNVDLERELEELQREFEQLKTN